MPAFFDSGRFDEDYYDLISFVAAFSGSGSLAISPMLVYQAPCDLTGTGTLATSPVVVMQGSAALSGTGTLAGTCVLVLSLAIDLAGTGRADVAAWAPGVGAADIATPAIYAEPMFSDIIFADSLTGLVTGNRLIQPVRGATSIRFYDRDGALVGIISTNSAGCILSSLQFELLDSGPGMFRLVLAQTPSFDLQHEYRMDVHLWNNVDAIYSGFIQRRPWPGTTTQPREYGGFGYSEHLNRVLITGEWANKYVYEILTDIVKDQIVPVTGVLYDSAQIEADKRYLVSEINFLRVPFREAIKQLSRLAGSSEYGVGADRKFFFRAPVETVTEHFWYGKHFAHVTGDEDSSKIINRKYIKLGKVRTDLNQAHWLFKTNWLEEYLENTESQETYGRRDGVYSAPSVFTSTDAIRATAAELDDASQLEEPVRVRDIIYTGTPILTRGKMRVIGRGGHELTLPKKRCRYTVQGSRTLVDVELSDLDRTPAEWLAELASREAMENLARQQSQQQL